jgi:hypothetical protein
MNLHRSCDKDENCLENIRSCPPEVKEMVDEFDELMQPEEHGNENVCFENADDSGEIEIERPRLTKCQVQIRFLFFGFYSILVYVFCISPGCIFFYFIEKSRAKLKRLELKHRSLITFLNKNMLHLFQAMT